MPRRTPRAERATHAHRRPPEHAGSLASAQRTDLEARLKAGRLATPAMIVSALAMERAESALHDLEIEHDRRAPARARRIEHAWQALRTAAQTGSGALAACLHNADGTITPPCLDAIAWMNGWDVIERSVDGTRLETIIENAMAGHQTLPLRNEDETELAGLIETLAARDPRTAPPTSAERAQTPDHLTVFAVRWATIARLRDEKTGIDDDEWGAAVLRSALIEWGMADTIENREMAAFDAACNAETLGLIEGAWSADRAARALTTYTDAVDSDCEDWVIMTGLDAATRTIGDNAGLARALRAVQVAGARRWRTASYRAAARGFLDDAHAIDAAARCADKLISRAEPHRRASLYRRWARCAWAIDDEDGCRALACKAIAIDATDTDAWGLAIRTTARPWLRIAYGDSDVDAGERRLWRAWHEALRDDQGAAIAATIAVLTTGGSGSARARTRRKDKIRARLAEQLATARVERADIEPRILWLASTLLQDDDSRQWNESVLMEQVLLGDDTLEDCLLINIAQLRLGEGRGIEPALEQLMARDVEDTQCWRTEALADQIDAHAARLIAQEPTLPKHLVIERGLRGPPHQRIARKERYERDAEWCTAVRERCKARHTGTALTPMWATLERIARAERRIQPTNPIEYRQLVKTLAEQIKRWSGNAPARPQAAPPRTTQHPPPTAGGE